MTTAVMAVPAKKKLWKTITLADGTEIRAQLRGDEFGHYWLGTDGKAYIKMEDGTYGLQTTEAIKISAKKRAQAQQRREMRSPLIRSRKNSQHRTSDYNPYVGQKKGLIILVEFKDTKFQSKNNLTLYNNIANTPGYKDNNGFNGSVSDYFKDQSRGLFELTFDVIGPVTVSKKASYYGENDSNGDDKYPEEMVEEAVKLAKNKVTDWKQYDWDSDGMVDQVMIIFAGEGEATGGAESTIWPHEYSLSFVGKSVQVATGLKVSTYAVVNEGEVTQDSRGNETFVSSGIGTICHEFSHCLGLLDMYDTSYSGNYGMGEWSVMDAGSYCGNGFCPVGYTSYDKYSIGWITPIELKETTSVSNMRSIDKSDDVYIISNKAYTNECYLIESRQQSGWDKYTPAKGMLILHIDYDEDIWIYNLINSISDGSYGYPVNDHQRCTIFHADGTDKTGVLYDKISEIVNKLSTATGSTYDKLVNEYYDLWDQYDADIRCDVYPQPNNNQLTNTSVPRAFLYNKNTDKRKLMNVSITDITQNNDGTMAFKFAPDNSGSGTEGDNTDYGKGGSQGGDTTTVRPSVEGALFYESFDNCAGEGGNDNLWNGGTTAMAAFTPDNEGWTYTKASGGNECAKFGTGSVAGRATTPAFEMDGTATLYFRAGAWDGSRDATALNLSVSNGTIEPKSVTMEKGEFSEFTATLSVSGSVKITFASAMGRFFLDEILVKDPNAAGIITVIVEPDKSGRIYTVDGRYVGTDMQQLKHGIYIVNGKKIVR
jgi:M6 family metalloprotease-like protein